MGMPMARHLAGAGYPLTVHDINGDALARLKGLYPGVTIATCASEVASASEIVISMLPSGREVRDTALGKDGLLLGFQAGSLLVDTSSSEPWYTQEINAALRTVGVAMLDAPVSGAEAGAIAAELVFMVGGDATEVQRVRPLLKILGKKIFHLGPVGAGHVMKSINNLITAVTFMATAEGLLIGKGSGLDPQIMNDVLNESTGMSWITRTHIGQRILSRRFDDPFKFDLMMKDINIALQVADDLHLELALCAEAQARWREIQDTIAKGSSVSELVRALETRTGLELTKHGGEDGGV
jgi:3-hydroxyisobutyrate dehydrogenase